MDHLSFSTGSFSRADTENSLLDAGCDTIRREKDAQCVRFSKQRYPFDWRESRPQSSRYCHSPERNQELPSLVSLSLSGPSLLSLSLAPTHTPTPSFLRSTKLFFPCHCDPFQPHSRFPTRSVYLFYFLMFSDFRHKISRKMFEPNIWYL